MYILVASVIINLCDVLFLTDSNCSKKSVEGEDGLECFVSLLPEYGNIQSITSFMKSRHDLCKSDENLAMDSLFILLQVISIVFSLAERHMQLNSVSAGDLLIITGKEENAIPTVYCHMVSVKKVTSPDYNLICEKLRMFLIQLTHASKRIEKSSNFHTVEDLIKNSEDAGDLKTIALIIQYILWGPKEDEIKVMSVADNRKQAFDLWLSLSRTKLLNGLLLHPMANLKMYTLASFLTNTCGQELFKLTKLLSTYR